MVLHTTPPQPRSNDLAITLALVPGGPLASRKGFSNGIRVTVVFRDGAMASSCRWGYSSRIVDPRNVLVRATCDRCRRPQATCYCQDLHPVPTRTHVVFLQHPRERRVAIGTARLAHLALANSELHVGVDFQGVDRVRALAAERSGEVALLFPSEGATDAPRLS